jgi:3-oxoisoapionate decarboxylase
MNDTEYTTSGGASRRDFLAASAAGMIGLGLSAATGAAAQRSPNANATGTKRRPRVGTATISFRHTVKSWQQEGFPAMKFLEASHRAGAEVVMLYDFLIDKLDSGQLKQLRARAEQLDVAIDASGQNLFRPTYEHTMENAAALGAKAIGAYSGMLLRPDKIATLELWDQHQARTEARLRELAPVAKRLGLVVALENHLDFTIEELVALMRRIDSPQIGVLFDVGNGVATLDDPIETAEALAPYTVATHFKDFAIEEVARGFRFTMVPLGAGSLQLREIARRLLPKVRPEANFCIEMMNGQQFEVNWLEDRFWAPYRGVTAQQVAATLRHIRGKAIDISRFVPEKDLETVPLQQHVQFEFDRIKECMECLKGLLDELAAPTING